MGIKGDLEELKKIWPTLSLHFKVFLFFSFIISCLSITSIADSVYELRGFIKLTIDFYQDTISPIFTYIFSLFGLEISQIKIDAIIFITLINASLIRANILYKNYGMPADFVTWFIFMYLVYNTNEQAVFGLVHGYFGIVFLIALLPYIFTKLKRSKLFLSYKVALINILAVIFFVSIVAGLSEGFSRAI